MKHRLPGRPEAQSWRQVDLAERLGVSRQTINAIEVGEYDPSLLLAFAIGKLSRTRMESIAVSRWAVSVSPYLEREFAIDR